MPSVNLNILPLGPVIDVHVGVSSPRREALTEAGQPVPSPVACRLLIDTGASGTCIDSELIKQLQLSPSGIVSIHIPSTNANQSHPCQQYDVSLLIPHPRISRVFSAIPIIASSFSHQGIDGLLGRDVLASCLLVYNGELGIYTLSF
ncbi:MAG: aspartyl protease family protein [Gammaproteobacteria bacterium]|nr:aspartyl protease family protein [Gammaproteobacteria bacterium]